jgi:serine protease Do
MDDEAQRKTMMRARPLLIALLALAAVLPACTVVRGQDTAGTRADPGFPAESPLAGAGPNRVVRVVDRVMPAVVSVVAESERGQGTGTGFVIRSDGVVVTNYHVVEGAQRLTVLSSDENPERYGARVIGGAPEADLAVLDIDAEGLETVPLGNSGGLQLGQQVVALGYALGLEGGPSVTTGIVSSLSRVVTAQDPGCTECPHDQRTYENVIQTDAAINPGNSGGPLVDLAGRVVGINTAGAGAAAAENIGFAIQIDSAKQTIVDAVDNPDQPVAYLGVSSGNASDPDLQFQLDLTVDAGAAVIAVSPAGPAEDAGIEAGDVIVGFGGEKVTGSDQLGELIHSHDPGDSVEVELVRGSSTETLTVELGTNPLPVP